MKPIELERRSFLWGSATLLEAWNTFGGSTRFASASGGLQFNEVQRYSLQEALKSMDKRYDPQVKMVTSSVSKVGYHTTLKSGTVHPTRTSLTYAVALLDSGEESRLVRAKEILDTVIDQQDQNPENRTYGIWSWYLEEPLDKMSPPDWNWADFCSVQLLAAWIDHRQRLGKELADRVRQSILHATQSIRKRNVSLGYTNIAIMGTYVTLVASDRFDQDSLRTYAKDRLRRYHKYLFEQGSFNEYNSPTYTVVAIKELARMLMHVRDTNDLKLIREIHDFAWHHATCRFHPPTRQWSGPHSRCYATRLRESTQAFLEVATGMKGLVLKKRPISLGIDSYRLPIQCPETCLKYFKPLTKPRTVSEVFIHSKPASKNITGTTYLHPKYTLGTVTRGDFWNQRRPFVAYWGTGEKPAYLQVRFLHDGYDYSSALPLTVQYKGQALTAVVFATDYGDTHISLDRVKDATIRAKDLRLRFEFGAEVDALKMQPVKDQEGMILVKDRDVWMYIRPLIDLFGNKRCSWEFGSDASKKWIDAVAYSGEETAIDFSKMEQALIAFAFQIGEDNPTSDSVKNIQIQPDQDGYSMVWGFKDFSSNSKSRVTLSMHAPLQPATRKILREKYEQHIDIEPL